MLSVDPVLANTYFWNKLNIQPYHNNLLFTHTSTSASKVSRNIQISCCAGLPELHTITCHQSEYDGWEVSLCRAQDNCSAADEDNGGRPDNGQLGTQMGAALNCPNRLHNRFKTSILSLRLGWVGCVQESRFWTHDFLLGTVKTKFVTAMSLLGQTLGLFAGVSLLSAIEALLVFPRAASLYTESFGHVFTFIYMYLQHYNRRDSKRYICGLLNFLWIDSNLLLVEQRTLSKLPASRHRLVYFCISVVIVNNLRNCSSENRKQIQWKGSSDWLQFTGTPVKVPFHLWSLPTWTSLHFLFLPSDQRECRETKENSK